MKLSDHKLDVSKLEEGDWVDNIPDMSGLRLKVKGQGNKAWDRLYGRLLDAVPRAKKLGRLDPQESDRIMAIVLRDCCLIDWEGLEDENDQPIPYSKAKADELLRDPAMRPFRDAVLWAATVVATKRNAEIEDDVKN